eukprot:753915-Hanusia_phi.AAC.4
MVKRKVAALEDQSRNDEGVDLLQSGKETRRSRHGLRTDKNLNLCTTCTACGVHFDWTGVIDSHGSRNNSRPDATNREMDALVSGLACFGKAAIDRIIENHLPHRTKQEIQAWISDLQASEDYTTDQVQKKGKIARNKRRQGRSPVFVTHPPGHLLPQRSRSQSERGMKDSSRAPPVSRGSKRQPPDSTLTRNQSKSENAPDGNQDERGLTKRKRESAQPPVEHHINLRSKSQIKPKENGVVTKKKGKKKHSDDIELLDGASALLGLSSDTEKNGKKSPATPTTPRTSGMSTRLSKAENSKSDGKEANASIHKSNINKSNATSTRSSTKVKETEPLPEPAKASKEPKPKAKSKPRGKSPVQIETTSEEKCDSTPAVIPEQTSSDNNTTTEAEDKHKEMNDESQKTFDNENEDGGAQDSGEQVDLPKNDACDKDVPWKASEVLMGSRIPEENTPRLSAAVVLMMNSSNSSRESSNMMAKGKNCREDDLNSNGNSPVPSSTGHSGTESSYLKTLEASPAAAPQSMDKAIEASSNNQQASIGYSEIIKKSKSVDNQDEATAKDCHRKRRHQSRDKHNRNSTDEAPAGETQPAALNASPLLTDPRPTALSVLIGAKYAEPNENVGSASEKGDVQMNAPDPVQKDLRPQPHVQTQQREATKVNEMIPANLSSDDQLNAIQETVNASNKTEGQEECLDMPSNPVRFEASENHKHEGGRTFLAPTAAQKWHQIHGSEGQRSAVQRYVQEKIKQGKIEKRPDGSLLLKEKNSDATCKFWSEINDELFKATLGSRVKVHAITQALRRYCGIATPPGNTRKTEYVDLLVPTDMGEREQALRKARESHAKYQNNQDCTWLDRRRQPRNEKGRSSAEVLLANCSVNASGDAVLAGGSDQAHFYAAHDATKRFDVKSRGRGRRAANDVDVDESEYTQASQQGSDRAVIVGMNWSQALTGTLDTKGIARGSQVRVSYGDALLNQKSTLTKSSGGDFARNVLDGETGEQRDGSNAETSLPGAVLQENLKVARGGTDGVGSCNVNNSDGTSEDAAAVDYTQTALDESHKVIGKGVAMAQDGEDVNGQPSLRLLTWSADKEMNAREGGKIDASKPSNADQLTGREADKSRSSEMRSAKSYAALVVEFGSAAAAIGKGTVSYASQLGWSSRVASIC